MKTNAKAIAASKADTYVKAAVVGLIGALGAAVAWLFASGLAYASDLQTARLAMTALCH